MIAFFQKLVGGFVFLGYLCQESREAQIYSGGLSPLTTLMLTHYRLMQEDERDGQQQEQKEK